MKIIIKHIFDISMTEMVVLALITYHHGDLSYLWAESLLIGEFTASNDRDTTGHIYHIGGHFHAFNAKHNRLVIMGEKNMLKE